MRCWPFEIERGPRTSRVSQCVANPIPKADRLRILPLTSERHGGRRIGPTLTRQHTVVLRNRVALAPLSGAASVHLQKEKCYVNSTCAKCFGLFSSNGMDHMKRIALLVCGVVLLAAGTAEARWTTPVYGPTYTQPARVAPASYSTRPAQTVRATAVSFSTTTAQGVANIMASQGRVGHWGGNPGYEGCGMGATPQAAFQSCCYSSSGMATVDVGYAQGANGMWYCCRRYR
jgi:hypothetical protein